MYAAFARDHEYKLDGTLSLLAAIDLLTMKVHALVKNRHRSQAFIEFLKLLDAASAHISRETRAWLDTRPAGPFLVYLHARARLLAQSLEGFFSKFARSILPHPVTSTMNSRTASDNAPHLTLSTGWPPSVGIGGRFASDSAPTNSSTPPDMIRTKKTLT
ncbi:hypothetical protein AB8Z38_17460 [Bradyrhizobium sp. LLZ17]|uniref:Transposase n=1 Tax=Bradyrhizobium sp. LLZ17 TaxID=3239388 RepID=A0AB39XUP7_9BRAD